MSVMLWTQIDQNVQQQHGYHISLATGQYIIQGSNKREKYLNIQNCLEKSLKIKFALQSN